jgi:RNA polymerase sigma-54 factor
MGIELKQQLRQGQHLVMTPQLQQAVKMLQMNAVELTEMIETELQENPMLELDETPLETAPPTQQEIDAAEFANYLDNGVERTLPNFNKQAIGDLPSFEATLTRPDSLEDYLFWQIRMRELSDTELAVAVFLIGNIDDRGYLVLENEEEAAAQLKVDVETFQRVIGYVQALDPAGVGARDLKECLLIQARRKFGEHALCTRIIADFLPELETKNFGRISRKLGLDEEEVKQSIRDIVTLDPKPGRGYSTEEPDYITPDIMVEKINDDYVIRLNDSGMPRLKINQLYRTVGRQKGVNAEAKDFIQEKLSAATSLIKSIHQRQRTIFRVTESIFKFQRDFLEKGVEHLRPLVLRDVAEDVGLHEGTVGRVTTNKYVHTPRGIFELKYFFNPGIQRNDGQADMASEAVKAEIKKILQAEDARNPLSDQAVVELLKEANINIARRTVTKYRELMGILPSNKRKQLV